VLLPQLVELVTDYGAELATHSCLITCCLSRPGLLGNKLNP